MPKTARETTPKNPKGAGPPTKFIDPVSIQFYAERDLREQFKLLGGGKQGAVAEHYRAALTTYLARPEIAAKLEEAQCNN